MRYVVVAPDGKVAYCRTRTEAIQVARQLGGRIYRADWSEVVEA